MSTKRVFALTVAATAGLALSACAESDDSATSAEPVTETVASVETVSEGRDDDADRDDRDDDADDRAVAPAQPAANGELPEAVTGYTDEARAGMSDENVSEADVEAALAAAHEGNASVEWEDDGYFEIEHGEVEIDIDPAGLVRDAGR